MTKNETYSLMKKYAALGPQHRQIIEYLHWAPYQTFCGGYTDLTRAMGMPPKSQNSNVRKAALELKDLEIIDISLMPSGRPYIFRLNPKWMDRLLANLKI
jgi:hypothetical protein